MSNSRVLDFWAPLGLMFTILIAAPLFVWSHEDGIKADQIAATRVGLAKLDKGEWLRSEPPMTTFPGVDWDVRLGWYDWEDIGYSKDEVQRLGMVEDRLHMGQELRHMLAWHPATANDCLGSEPVGPLVPADARSQMRIPAWGFASWQKRLGTIYGFKVSDLLCDFGTTATVSARSCDYTDETVDGFLQSWKQTCAPILTEAYARALEPVERTTIGNNLVDFYHELQLDPTSFADATGPSSLVAEGNARLAEAACQSPCRVGDPLCLVAYACEAAKRKDQSNDVAISSECNAFIQHWCPHFGAVAVASR